MTQYKDNELTAIPPFPFEAPAFLAWQEELAERPLTPDEIEVTEALMPVINEATPETIQEIEGYMEHHKRNGRVYHVLECTRNLMLYAAQN